jgi:hypothetical protein
MPVLHITMPRSRPRPVIVAGIYFIGCQYLPHEPAPVDLCGSLTSPLAVCPASPQRAGRRHRADGDAW